MYTNALAIAPVSVSPRDAGRLIGLSRTKIFELIREGDLRVAKIGRRTLVPVTELHALIERKEVAAHG